MRNVVLEEDHPQSKTGSRKAWMECSKAELIFALEASARRIRQLEGNEEKLYLRISGMHDDYGDVAQKLRGTKRELYDQMDTAIGLLLLQAEKRASNENGSIIAMAMVRAVEQMIEEFAMANPGTRSYECAVTLFGADSFYNLCKLAKYIPRPRTRAAILYEHSYERPRPDTNYYEYINVHDATDDEFADESLPSQPELDY